jgi:hypothetical protein
MPDRAGRHAAVVILAGWCMIFAGVSLAAASTARAQEGGPTKHFSVDNPAELSDADAEDIYRRLTAPLRKGYGLSDHPVARAYQSWSRYNTAPSSTIMPTDRPGRMAPSRRPASCRPAASSPRTLLR